MTPTITFPHTHYAKYLRNMIVIIIRNSCAGETQFWFNSMHTQPQQYTHFHICHATKITVTIGVVSPARTHAHTLTHTWMGAYAQHIDHSVSLAVAQVRPLVQCETPGSKRWHPHSLSLCVNRFLIHFACVCGLFFQTVKLRRFDGPRHWKHIYFSLSPGTHQIYCHRNHIKRD